MELILEKINLEKQKKGLRIFGVAGQVARPQSHRRLSTTPGTPSGVHTRQSATRHHSHSVSLGVINPSHRVTRRKSTNASSANPGAVRTALNEFGLSGSNNLHHLSFSTKNQRFTQGPDSVHGERQEQFASEQPCNNSTADGNGRDFAIADGHAAAEHASNVPNARARRASEGSHLTKAEGRRSSGELRCEKCGKGYKHSSCLTKHLWEHDPAWAYTSKLFISKHQQVQLLEAASVLVNMNQDEPSATESLKMADNDNSSASPAASGSSDLREDYDEYSSAETTPPPMSEHHAMPYPISTGRSKRHSGGASSHSRSYQSAPSASFSAGHGFSQSLSHRRPSTAELTAGLTGEEEASLAAAVESLCNFGTPKTGPVLLPPDVPPVPPVPAQYAEQHQRSRSGNLIAQSEWGLTSPSYQPLSSERDVKMGDEHFAHSYDENEYDEPPLMHHGKSDEDEGVFGGMEGIAHDAHEDLSHA
ncbi:MAG: hypothetical protein Q9163_002360 [Psora crenata]